MATENIDTGNQSTTGTGDSGTGGASLLERSPWGRLSEVTSTETVLEGFGSATGGGTSSGAPSGAGGGNPFTNFGNPNASGSPLTGGTNPWAAIGTSGGSASSSGTPSDSNTSGDGSTSGFGGASSGSQPPSGNTSGGDASGGSQPGGAGTSGFETRVSIDNLVNGQLTEALGDQLPTNQAFSSGNNPFDPGFGSNVSNQATQRSQSGSSDGGSTGGFGGSQGGGFGGGNQGGGFGGGSQGGGFGGGSQSGDGGASGPISPFDQLRANLDNYFASGEYQSGSSTNLNPFNGGGFGGGSQGGGFGGGSQGGGFGGGDSNQSGSPFSGNASANQIDATRSGLTNSITGQVSSGNPDSNAIAGEISDSVAGLVTSITSDTPSSTDVTSPSDPLVNVQESALVTELSDVLTAPEENVVIQSEVIPLEGDSVAPQSDIIGSLETSSVDTLNEPVTDSSMNAGYPTQQEFLDILNGGDLTNNLPDYLSEDARAYIQGQVSTIRDNIGGYQEIGNLFADGNNPFAGGSNPFASGDNQVASGSNLFI